MPKLFLPSASLPTVCNRLVFPLALLSSVLLLPGAATAQNLEHMLDQVSGSFSSAPQPQAAPQTYYGGSAPYAPQYNMGGQQRQAYYPTQNWAQSTPPPYVQQPPLMQQLQTTNGYTSASPIQRLRAMYGGGNGSVTQAPAPAPNPRQSLMKIFFGDGSSPSTSSANAAQKASDDASKLQTARENLSVARNQEQRAENAASRASYGSDKYARKEAASEARYAARASRLAADRATAAGYNGGPAGDVAAEARGAADNAQAAADRAEANANGGGW